MKPPKKETMKLLVGKNTRILLIMNGFGIDDIFSSWFSTRKIFGGNAFVAVTRCYSDDGRRLIVHDHLANSSLHIGHLDNDLNELLHVKSLWEKIILDVHTVDSLDYAR